MIRNILVTGATGKQGTAVIRALLTHNNNSEVSENDQKHKYHIFALTRKPEGVDAEWLVKEKDVTVLEGDLDVVESVERVFEVVKGMEGGLWGVFTVLKYPGLGACADGEERQGKMLADMALKYGVQSYVYSSSARAGPKYDSQLTLSSLAKARVEQHCMNLDEKGLPWTIIRPAFFVENFDDFIGSITVSVLKTGLNLDTEVAISSTEDIGNVTAGVFNNHEKFRHKILAPCSESITMSKLEESYQLALGSPISAVPMPFAWFIIKTNTGTQDLLKQLEIFHSARKDGNYTELEEEIKLANQAYPLKTYHDWLLHRRSEEKTTNSWGAEWNGVSLKKLLTGRL